MGAFQLNGGDNGVVHESHSRMGIPASATGMGVGAIGGNDQRFEPSSSFSNCEVGGHRQTSPSALT